MIFRILKSIRALPFLSANLNRAGASGARREVEEYDPGPPTTTILYPDSRECERCEHFGNWFPVRVNDQIDYNSFAGCLRPGAERIVELPLDECPFWVKSRINSKRPPH